ncbi:MAG: DUF3108 domain-containing protein [bacterium]|jgi:hypothetical protein|nr:DUF3108 domain-containing protein [bacterium]
MNWLTRWRRPSFVAGGLLLLGGLAVLTVLAYQGSLQRGLELWTEGRAGEALAEFRRQEAQGEELARLNRLIAEGEVAREERGPESRRSLLRVSDALATLAPRSPYKTTALYQAGRMALAGGDRARGLKLLETAYRQQPKNQAIANLLLETLLSSDDHKRLRETARHHLEQRPDNPLAWYAQGEAERRAGQDRRALASWNRGLALFPLRPMLESAIVLAQAQGQGDQARDWLLILRLRYQTASDGRPLEAWCVAKGLHDVWAALPADREAGRYAVAFPEFFPPGRQWTYKVRYGIIPLGQLVVGVRGREEVRRGAGVHEAMRVYYKIDSNPAYRMIIDLHDVYESLIPTHCLHSLEFKAMGREGEDRNNRIYIFDVDSQRVTVRGFRPNGEIFREELPLANQVFDGLSLLFAARRQVRDGRFGPVLTFVDEEVRRTVIRRKGCSQAKVLGRMQPVVEIHGQADYRGIAGLTGEFWGQFSDDQEALPLTARFQIKLGKITLELDEVADVR